MLTKTKINSMFSPDLFRTIRKWLLLVLFSFIIVSFFDISFTFASNGAPDTPKATGTEATKWLSGLIEIVWTLLGLLTALVALLLNPGWINWEIFWLTWYLKDMWVLISNFVYIIFALLLIVIAFMNIIWKWWDKFELKQALPKFIVGILIVPLSWFFVQFTLTISSFLTVQVLALPYETFKTEIPREALEKENICQKRVLNMNSSESTAAGTSTPPPDAAGEIWKHSLSKSFNCATWSPMLSIKSFFTWEWLSWNKTQSLYGIISVYTFWIMDYKSLNEVKWKDLWFLSTIFNISAKVLVDLIFIIVYLILLVALFLALFTRWIYLWLYAMFSPLFWLVHFFWWHVWKDWFIHHFNFKDFIALAMVPVYVSAALSFWLLFLLVAGKWLTENKWDQAVLSNNWINIWWMSIEVIWSPTPDKPSDPNTAFSLMTNWAWWAIWKLIVQVFWIALLWIAVMAALWASEMTHHIIEPFEKFWKSVWWLIMHAPQYMPIPGTGWMTMWWVAHAWNAITSQIEWIPSKSWNKWAQDKFPWLFNEDSKEIISQLEKLNAAKNSGDPRNYGVAVREILSKIDEKNLSQDARAKWWLLEFARKYETKLGDKYKSIEEWINSWKANDFSKAIADLSNGVWLVDGKTILWGTSLNDTEATAKAFMWSWRSWNDWTTAWGNMTNYFIPKTVIKDDIIDWWELPSLVAALKSQQTDKWVAKMKEEDFKKWLKWEIDSNAFKLTWWLTVESIIKELWKNDFFTKPPSSTLTPPA